jgi:hypothetical protein
MISNMNGRQFKKLCKKAHALVIQIDPRADQDTYRAIGDESWWHSQIKKGTMGFGAMSGYYEPEWDDYSAWSTLINLVFWNYCDMYQRDQHDWPTWPTRTKPRRAQDYIALAKRMIAKNNAKKGKPV